MDEKLIRRLAKDIAKDLKSEEDLSNFTMLFRKIMAGTAGDAELIEHLAHEGDNPVGNDCGKRRYGKAPKCLKSDYGG